MDNPVIGMSESQWYCNECQQTHYGDSVCPMVKRKKDKQYMLGFEHGYQQGKTMSKDCENCKYKALAILHTGYKGGEAP